MKIYISGKISGLPKAEYKFKFHKATIDIIKNNPLFTDGTVIINPLHLKPFLGIKIWVCYMITDLYYLRKCTHIALMSNWKDSKGACIEHFIGKFIFKLKIIWL